MTSETWKKTIAMHILSNISRSKGNQTMNFGQLIEYGMRNIFVLKNNTHDVMEELFQYPFLKKQN